jgi:lipopolysaccharide biosynthesis regulator YciM
MSRRHLPLVAIWFGLWCVCVANGYGQQAPTRVTPAISEPVYTALAKAQRLVAAGDLGAARELLDALREGRRLTPYELAQSWNYTAYIELQRGAYADAITAYQAVLEQDGLPEALLQGTHRTLAQLHFTVGEYARAIEGVRAFERQGGTLDRDLHLLLGQAHYELAEFAAARPHVERVVAMSRASGMAPPENVLLLLQAIHHQREDLDGLESVSRELAARYPKPRHLRTLAGVYSRRGDMRKLLAIMEALHERQALDGEADLRNLANLYLLQQTPAKAARLLERELANGGLPTSAANWQLVGEAWVQAREPRRAIEPLGRALDAGGEAEISLRLARLHLDLDEWDAAASVLAAALARGGLQRPDQARLMLGSAEFNRGEHAAARRAFLAAREDQRSVAAAERWLSYLDEEMRRRRLLEARAGPGGTDS